MYARSGILLIFDEVISGFRASAGGAQAIFGVRPDLTCLGKIIGGGLPVGAYGGRADDHGHGGARGPGVSGGHAVGESGRDDGRTVGAEAARRRSCTRISPARVDAGRRVWRRRRARRAWPCRSTRSARC